MRERVGDECVNAAAFEIRKRDREMAQHERRVHDVPRGKDGSVGADQTIEHRISGRSGDVSSTSAPRRQPPSATGGGDGTDIDCSTQGPSEHDAGSRVVGVLE